MPIQLVLLFKQTKPQEVREQLQSFGVRESVVKCGEQGVCCYGGNDSFSHLPFTPAENQLDSKVNEAKKIFKLIKTSK